MLPDIAFSLVGVLDASILRSALSRALVALREPPKDPYLNAVNFKFLENAVEIVSTNARVVGMETIALTHSIPGTTCLVPVLAVKTLCKVLDGVRGSIALKIRDIGGQLLVEDAAESFQVLITLNTEEYVPYTNLTPKKSRTLCTLPGPALKTALTALAGGYKRDKYRLVLGVVRINAVEGEPISLTMIDGASNRTVVTVPGSYGTFTGRIAVHIDWLRGISTLADKGTATMHIWQENTLFTNIKIYADSGPVEYQRRQTHFTFDTHEHCHVVMPFFLGEDATW